MTQLQPMVTDKQWNQAIEDLTLGIIELTRDIKFKISDKTTNNYNTFLAEPSLTISREGCYKTIYGNPYVNILARAWHDTLHISKHKSFSLEDELAIAKLQKGTLFNTLVLNGIPTDRAELASIILFIDIYEQALYYDKTKNFVGNQLDFVKSKLNQYLKA